MDRMDFLSITNQVPPNEIWFLSINRWEKAILVAVFNVKEELPVHLL